MRICLVSQEFPPETAFGGIGSQTWNKAHALAGRGHEVHVVSVAGGRTDDASVRLVGSVTVHRLRPPGEWEGFGLYDESAYWVGRSWTVAQYIDQLVRSVGLDLIDFAEYGAEGFTYSINRSPHNAIPTVVQLHGPLALFVDTISWPEPSSRFERVGTFMEAEVIRAADALMSCSANIADFTARRYGIDRSRIHVVHCGVDTATFSPRVDDGAARPTVLFLGNVAENKGVVTVFEAVLRLREAHPDILLRIGGKGGEDLTRRLLDRAAAAGASQNLEMLGFVSGREETAELFRQADVFASPAQHEPGVANVYIEAMAAGIPVVAASTGAAPEAVVDGKTGMLVRPGDVEATAEALDTLLSQPDLGRSMGMEGRQVALTYFSLDSYTERVLAVYQDAIETARSRSLSECAAEL